MLKPKKSLGQHFLHDMRILGEIVSAGRLTKSDRVLEIGPGNGVLTELIGQKTSRVIAVEKDEKLCALLKAKFCSKKNIELVCADALKFNPARYALYPYSYKIVANIPYYITGRLLRLIYGAWPIPKLAVLMLQKEVALRLIAKPPKMNRLAAIVSYFAKPHIVKIVSRNAFRPRPKVDSAIVVLESRGAQAKKDARIADLIATGFSQPRKRLFSNLKNEFGEKIVADAFEKMALQPNIRASQLEISDWEQLFTLLYRK